MDGDAEATLGEEQGKSTYKPKTKLDHLGQPITKGATQRYRYARTYTVIYDGAGGMDAATSEKTWRLLLDTGRAISLRTDSLQKLFRILQNAAPTREHALIGPKAFKLAMQQFGLNDPILVSRLFGEFKEGASTMMGARIDFRQFVRVLCTMSKEAIEDRLALLFDVWDADDSGSLSFAELASHVVHDLPVHKMESAMHAFNSVWSQVKNFSVSYASKVEEKETFLGGVAGAAAEVGKEALVEACRKLPAVRRFFEEMLTRRPPKADELARKFVSSNFQARLRELDAEVWEEVRVGPKGDDAEGARPGTAPGGRSKEAGSNRVKEKTNEILTSVKTLQTSSLSITQSSSAKAVAAAREQANAISRPKTAALGGGSRRPARDLHRFVRSSSQSDGLGAKPGSLEMASRQSAPAI